MFAKQLLSRPRKNIIAVRRELGTLTSIFAEGSSSKQLMEKWRIYPQLQAVLWLGMAQGSRNAVCQPQYESPTTKVGLQRPIQYRHAAVFLLQNMGLRAQ